MSIFRQKTEKISKFLDNDDLIIITGPRQSGKTTVLRQLEKILKKDKKHVIYFTLEDIEYLSELNKTPKNIFKLFPLVKKNKTFFLIDEIQYLDNPTNFLKYLYDMHKDTLKLIVSGSSAFYIDRKFQDSLAGRKKIFQLLPMGFYEFLIFKGHEELTEFLPEEFDPQKSASIRLSLSTQNQLEILFNEYLIYGGYPRIVLADEHEEKIDLLQDLAVSYVKKDILEANIQYEDIFYKLLKIFANQTGSLVNTNELANTLGVSKKAIDNYLTIMKKSYHLTFISPFYKNLRKELTKMPKVYFNDLGLRNHFCNNFNSIKLREDKGSLCENYFFVQLINKLQFDDIRFWRTINKNEIDFIVKEKYAFEIKYSFRSIFHSRYKKFIEGYPDISLLFSACEGNTEETIPVYLI